MSLHHKLCHVLGSSFDIPHAQVHTVMLPHVLAYNAEAAPAARSVLAETPASDDPGRALWDLVGRLGVPRHWPSWGCRSQGSPRSSPGSSAGT